MAQTMAETHAEKETIRVPEWLYTFSDEQFVFWCSQFRLQVCEEVRPFSREERAAIYRYMVRQHLIE